MTTNEARAMLAGLRFALAHCATVSADYQARAADGKLGSIRRNRNNWKVDAANECHDAIAKEIARIEAEHDLAPFSEAELARVQS